MTVPVILAVLALYVLFIARTKRGLAWVASQLTPTRSATPATLSDVVSYSALIVTVLGLTIGYFTLSAENMEASLENQKKDLNASIANLDLQLRNSQLKERPDFAPGVDIHLESPPPEAAIIRTGGPELRWQYAKHSDRVNYILNIVRIDAQANSSDGPALAKSCNFESQRTCTFYATGPAAQRSFIPLDKPGPGSPLKLKGKFLWRVVPAKARSDNAQRDFSPISQWSEYSSFETYPDLATRQGSGNILVGTTYSDNIRFSSIDGHGHHQGYDMDLIWALIEQCIDIRPKGAFVNAANCQAQIQAFRAYARDKRELRWKKAEIRTYPSVDDGLSAVQRREIDLFIGSVTRAAARQVNGLRFTTGYYHDFHTRLYGRRSQRDANEGIRRWASGPKRIGVIQKSTNEWLAQQLKNEPGFADISVVGLPDYASLKGAFETRRIEAVLVDDVLGRKDLMDSDPCEVIEIAGLERTGAWSRYHKELNLDEESFAIAVATMDLQQNADLLHRLLPPQPGYSLYSALNGALTVLSRPDGRLLQEFERSLESRNELDKSPAVCPFVEPNATK